MNKVKVLYVEDDSEWRNGLSDFFSGHGRIDLFACAASIEEGFAILRDEHIDVVVLDIIMNHHKLTGLDAALDITIQYPEVKIIMLSSLQDDDDIFNEAFMNGAYDYLYKDDFEKLPETICEAMNNRMSKYGARLKKLVYEKKRNLMSSSDRTLLRMISNGKTQVQIAEELNVSLAAVKKQVGRVMKKFDWKGSSYDLAEKCCKWGLLEEE
ncbi:response regulator transcription factor [Paenibacillus senegalensis]|uniref:response regulator transcription factor n=1 Tax=Paenibacillus senegalensis TaxID=1465766 RepID=UPI0002888AC9|nr:response regulator transcription factor [Paenibacillus senegalensis]